MEEEPLSPWYSATRFFSSQRVHLPVYTGPLRVWLPPFRPDWQRKQLGKMQPVRSSFTSLSFMLIPPVSTTFTVKPSLAVSSVTISWISFASSPLGVEG